MADADLYDYDLPADLIAQEPLADRAAARLMVVRRGTGGRGRHRGGDGAIREIEFLRPASVSILSQRRIAAPPGAEGGEPGACGRQWIVRRDGSREAIPGVAAVELSAGEAIRIETPGGGGWGAPP